MSIPFELNYLFADLTASFILSLPMLFISLKAYIISGVVMAFLFPLIFLSIFRRIGGSILTHSVLILITELLHSGEKSNHLHTLLIL